MKNKFKVKGKRFARPFYLKNTELIPVILTFSQCLEVMSTISNPLKFKSGGFNNSGKSIVGERGEEYIIYPDGSKTKAPN